MKPALLLGLALGLWLLASVLRRRSGLPSGQVVYSDAGGWSRPEKALFSARLQLTGKPDYLVRAAEGYIPVEVKSGRAPANGAYAGHIAQLSAYCALVTEAYGTRPAYGLIRYADRTVRVEYTPELEAGLERQLRAMRAAAAAGPAARSHQSPGRCRACGWRAGCEESLA